MMYVRWKFDDTSGNSIGPFEETFSGTPIFSRKAPYTVPTEVWGHGTSALTVGQADQFMREVFGSLGRDNLNLLEGIDVQLHIVPHDKKLTDLDEFASLRGTKTDDGRSYDDLRGIGGMKFGNSILYAISQDTLVRIPGTEPSGYYAGFVVSHETGHVVEQFALTKSRRKRLEEAYNERKKGNGPWLNPPAYTSSDLHEYFAQATAAFFGYPLTNSAADREMYTRAWLKENDRPMHRLLSDIYQASATAKNRG